jgi:hypothetical protein
MVRVRVAYSFPEVLCVYYLGNHVFFDPEIERSIAARDVFFCIGDAQLRASSICASPNKIFLGAHGQEFYGARNSTLTRIPINTGIGSPF